MATPHVAGAAALLEQAHPDLTGPELKDVLASTSADVGLTWYQQGAGRVDVARAVEQGVSGSSSVSFGDLSGKEKTATRQVTYSNHTDTAVTLNLAAEVTNRENGEIVAGFSLSADTVTVLAGGNASVTATVDPTQVEGWHGGFGGAITATNTDADITLRTGVSFGLLPERLQPHDITVKVLDSNGDLVGSPTAEEALVLFVWDDWDPAKHGSERAYHPRGRFVPQWTVNGVTRFAFPTGVYSAFVNVSERHPNTGELTRYSRLVELEAHVDSDTTIILDAREATAKAAVTVPRDTDVRARSQDIKREVPIPGNDRNPWALVTLATGGPLPIHVTPTAEPEIGTLSLLDHWVLAEPKQLEPMPSGFGRFTNAMVSEAPAYIYHLPLHYWHDGIPENLTRHVTHQDLVEVPTRFHADSDDPDTIIRLATSGNWLGVGWHGGTFFVPVLYFRPGVVTQHFLPDERILFSQNVEIRRPDPEAACGPNENVPDPDCWFHLVVFDRFAESEAGTRRPEVRWFEAPLQLGSFDIRDDVLSNQILQFSIGNNIVPGLARGGANGNTFLTTSRIMGSERQHFINAPSYGSRSRVARWRMWNLDTGTQMPGEFVYEGLSSERAKYRLEVIERQPDDSKGPTGIFRSKPAPFVVSVDSPSAAAGAYHGELAWFGPIADPPGVAGEIVVVDDDSNQSSQGCGPLVGFPAGAVALVDRGGCSFVQKVTNAQDAGATATIVANDRDGWGSSESMRGSGPEITIPAVMVAKADGEKIKAGLPASGKVSVTGASRTAWTFTSEHSDAKVPDGYRCWIRTDPVCQIQPLIQLRHHLNLDIHNYAPAGRAHTFTIDAGSHSKVPDRAPVTSMNVEASFDGGQSWTDARVVGKPQDVCPAGGDTPNVCEEPDQRFRVLVKHPPLHRTDGFVALRVKAEDADGNTVEQTMIRAYALKGKETRGRE